MKCPLDHDYFGFSVIHKVLSRRTYPLTNLNVEEFLSALFMLYEFMLYEFMLYEFMLYIGSDT